MAEVRLAIVADDLTGALDSAAAFASIPGGVAVATGPEALALALATEPGVVAVSTRSREIAPGAARARVADVLAALPPGIRLFKKIDSRLKGNLPAELAAFPGSLLVAPAIPEFGRFVRGGQLVGFGVDAPQYVARALGAVADRALIPDTEDAAGMAEALAAAPDEAILVGARGLAQALAGHWGLPAAPFAPLPGPVLMAIGSTDPITRAQIDALRVARPGALFIDAPDGRIGAPQAADLAVIAATAGPGAPPGAVADRIARGVVDWADAYRGVLLSGGATAEVVLRTLGIDVLHIEGEALPGLPLTRAAGRVFVTKSGGFGDPDTLVTLAAQAAAAKV